MNMEKKKDKTIQYGKRPPIVTFMGHVDHGKTSILDYIRKTNIQQKEYGGITQHIGAYQIQHNNEPITFIDTPGHAAFTQMRSRGGRAADIVVLVVAAEESVKPQTKEAISHAKAAGVPIIVAINKMDKPGANPEKVKQDLAQEGIMVEDWGGDVVTVEVSAKTGDGISDLLDAINAVAEILDLKANPEGELEATIIESRNDKKRGTLVSAIIQSGKLKVGDEISASGFEAKVKFLMDDKGIGIKEAGLSKPVEIMGFKELPNVGDLIVEKGSDLAELSVDENRTEIVGKETKKTVGIIIKADTQGTLEAVKASLAALVTESIEADYSMRFTHTSTGAVSDSDVLLASNTNSIIVGFNVKKDSSVDELAQDLGVIVKTYNTIYELIDEVKDLLEGTASKEVEKIKGRAEVIKTFKLPSGDVIAGCNIIAGSLKPKFRIAIYDKNPSDITEADEPLYLGSIKKLKQGKNDVSVAGINTECGVLLKPHFNDLRKGYWIEAI
jgi:translation initiation factor IF-2